MSERRLMTPDDSTRLDADTEAFAAQNTQPMLAWLARRGLWIVGVLLIAAGLSTAYYVRNALEAAHQDTLLENADNLASSVMFFRNFYSKNILPRARDAGMQITSDYKNTPHALPLPATFTLDFGDFLADMGANATIALFSDYPFANRVDRKLDAFQVEALAHLRKDPDTPFFRIETIGGRQTLRYVAPDRMQPSCVGCHNTTDGSPKRDWKVGDVRGALEVRQPVGFSRVQNDGPQALKHALSSLTLISLALGLLMLGAVAGLRSYLNRNLALVKSENETNVRLKAEAVRRSESEQLARFNETRLKQIFNSVLEGVIVIDSQGVITEINDAALSMFGYSRATLIGTDVSVLMPEKVGAAHATYLERYQQGGNPWMLTTPRRVIARRRDGSEFPIRIAVSETKMSQSRLYTAVIQDISVAEQTERSLLKAKEAAEAANQLKSEFLANMSHELRTPLNAILGHAQLMNVGLDAQDQSAGLEREEVKEHSNQIMQSGWHLLSLIEEVLDLSKIESGISDIELQTVDLHAIVQACQVQQQVLAAKSDVQLLDSDFVPGTELIRADARRIRQVLINLLSNAIKYNRPKGTVQILVRPAGPRRVAIEVRDTGRGMTGEQLSQLFRPFVRFVQTGEVIEGSGIGLALSRRLIEQMNGTLTVRSEPHVGSSFVVEMDAASTDQLSDQDALSVETTPRAQSTSVAADDATSLASELDSGAAQASPQELEGSRVADDDRPPLRVLYIEDTPANYEVVRLFLEMRGGFVIQNAADGETGLRVASETQPDLILLDMSLPGMQGMEVRQKLAQSAQTASIPVIALSAVATREDIDLALEAGFTDYLTKPVRLSKLGQILEKYQT
jgi:PAS domain S-box-containing protein